MSASAKWGTSRITMVSLLEVIIRCIPASISEKTDVRSVFTGAYLCARAVRGSGFSDSRLVVLRQNPQFQLKKRQPITIHTKAIFVFSGYLLQCNHLPPMHPWPLISTEGVVPQGVSGKGIIYWLSQSSMVFRLFFGPRLVWKRWTACFAKPQINQGMSEKA